MTAAKRAQSRPDDPRKRPPPPADLVGNALKPKVQSEKPVIILFAGETDSNHPSSSIF
jgi:hypothetical protein